MLDSMKIMINFIKRHWLIVIGSMILICLGFIENFPKFEWNAAVIVVALITMYFSHYNSNNQFAKQMENSNKQFFFEKRMSIVNELDDLIEEIRNRNIEKQQFYKSLIDELCSLNRLNQLEEWQSYCWNREQKQNTFLCFDNSKLQKIERLFKIYFENDYKELSDKLYEIKLKGMDNPDTEYGKIGRAITSDWDTIKANLGDIDFLKKFINNNTPSVQAYHKIKDYEEYNIIYQIKGELENMIRKKSIL